MKICPKCGAKFESDNWGCRACGSQPKIVDGFISFAQDSRNKNEGFRVSRFESLAKLQAKNFWFRGRNKLICWALRKHFPQAKNFLEVGCGTGFVLSGLEKEFGHLDVSGCDLYIEGLRHTKASVKRARLFQMDARNIPYEDEFDVIGIFDILEHIEDDTTAISQLYRALHKGAGLIITVPQHPFLWSYVDRIACHIRRYRAKDLKYKVEKAGFEVIKLTSFMSLLLPLLALFRLKQQREHEEKGTRPDLALPVWLNSLFEKILNFEIGLIRNRLTLPFGGSLLLVARKL